LIKDKYLGLRNGTPDTLNAPKVSSVPTGVAPKSSLETIEKSQCTLGLDNLGQSIQGTLVFSGLIEKEGKQGMRKPHNELLLG
jgi:hypothetical protein